MSERRLHVLFRDAQMAAQLVQNHSFLLQRVDDGLRLERLRRQVLHGLAMLVQLAVRPERLLRRQLRLFGRVLQRRDALVDLFELAGAAVQR